MTWTKEKPTIDGFYWMNGKVKYVVGKVETFTEIVQIIKEGSEQYIYFIGNEADQNLNQVKDAYFFGPLEVPPNAPL